MNDIVRTTNFQREALYVLKGLLDRNNYAICGQIPECFDFSEVFQILPYHIFKNCNSKNGRKDTFMPFHPAYCDAFQKRNEGAYILWKLFGLGRYIESSELYRIAGKNEVDALVGEGLLKVTDNGITSRYMITNCESLYLLSSFFHNCEANHVYIGSDSKYMAGRLNCFLGSSQRKEKGLDIGTGSGIQALILSRYCDHVTAVDVNPHAIKVASMNSVLNGVENIDFIESDLFSNVGNSRFDVIVSNPPYVFLSDDKKDIKWAYGGNGLGTDIPMDVLGGIDKHLKSDGRIFMVSVTPVKDGNDLFLKRIEEKFKRCSYNFTYDIYSVSKFLPEPELYHKHGIFFLNCIYLEMKNGDDFRLEVKNLYRNKNTQKNITLNKIMFRILDGIHHMDMFLGITKARMMFKKASDEYRKGNSEAANELFRKVKDIYPYMPELNTQPHDVCRKPDNNVLNRNLCFILAAIYNLLGDSMIDPLFMLYEMLV